jgi:glycosyltransferase involved in cell wall biosynthesis
MKVGIFSKLGARGGSEHRCVEMANALIEYTPCDEVVLFCENDLDHTLQSRLHPGVRLVKHIFKPLPLNAEELYTVDSLLIVNSDSQSFTQLDYWEGRMEKHHDKFIDVGRIPQMVFLFNFVIGPARHLEHLAQKSPDVRIVCANQYFNHEINTDVLRFSRIRHLPRIVLQSPISPAVAFPKSPSDRIRIGRHSMPYAYKFDRDNARVIDFINSKYGDRVCWDFMGVPQERMAEISDHKNLTIRPVYSMEVSRYLAGIDIFLFLIEWGRAEPWARSTAEAMMSGCPILATNKAGNKDQVVQGNNGFLCDSASDFIDHLGMLIENEGLRKAMSRNSRILAQAFRSDKVVLNYLDFIRA